MKKKKYIFSSLLACLVLLALLHPLINYFGARYINLQLKDGVENYTGQIEKLRVNLFTGSYRIHHLKLVKISTPKPPFLDMDLIIFSLSWRSLFKGELRGKVHLESSRINIVDNKSSETSQNGLDGKGWLPTADALFPLNIETITFNKLDLTLNTGGLPQAFGLITNLRGEISNITNIVNPNENKMAQVDVTASVGKKGQLDLTGDIDFITPSHQFKINSALDHKDLSEFNDLFDHYAGTSTRGGELYLGVNVTRDEKKIHGKIKPILKGLDLLYKKEYENGLSQVLKDHALAFANVIFTNDEKDQAATVIEFTKDRDELEIHNWQAFVALFKNAFIQPLEESIPR